MPAAVRTACLTAKFPVSFKWNLQGNPESWNMGLGGWVLGSPILYLKGMRILIFQLFGFYYKPYTPSP